MHGKGVFVAVLSFVLLLAGILYVPHAIYTDAYGKVTHNSIPKVLIPSINVKPLSYRSNSHLIGERAALKITNPMMKYYKGTSRDIELVSTSVSEGSTYAHLSSSKTQGDPNFTRSGKLWEDIPCYIVVIKNLKRQMVWGAPLAGGTGSFSAFAIAIVDATSGRILNSYVTKIPKGELSDKR